MSPVIRAVRKQSAGILAAVIVSALFVLAQLPAASAAERADMASKYRFTEYSIALPGGYRQQTQRDVNQDYKDISAWISSVGAGISMNDLDADGLANDLCTSDPRVDQVIVSPTPGAAGSRYQPFVLDPAPLPMDELMAPMGCVPADYNEDGRIDILVYYWGRTPIVFLARDDVDRLSAASYRAVELVPATGSRPGYLGARWNSNAASVADFDGDGHDDVYVGNYFPDGLVLGSANSGGVTMNHSMSRAFNGGDDHILRWTGSPPAAVAFTEAKDVLSRDVSHGWALASGATDLDGDLLPELYIGNDFGPDRLLHNMSTPGNIRFESVETPANPWTPNSKRVGADSFKGMGMDFGDLNHDGLYDIFVSNITTTFGLEESHFAFVSTKASQAGMRTSMLRGEAPYEDRSADLGLAWSGWGWDVKMADFNNSGDLSVVQANGFVKGAHNRWPQLQELAASNDQLIAHEQWWPNLREGDDIGGFQHLHFFAKGPGGRYTDISTELGMAVPVPTRGIAVGDSDGDGALDFAVARQWDAPVFYHNESPARGAYVGLRLTHPQTATDAAAGASTAAAGELAGSPMIGAQATVTLPDGRIIIGRVDGGSGHSGRRSHEIVLGLGNVNGPFEVKLQWRDRAGQVHEQSMKLDAGWHSFQLGSDVKETPA